MKFAEKYEILEMVTSGRVSTFLARERATQEGVVVYTFDCSGTGARDLSTASIISRFCALAPNPPGMIVKAGFDEPSSSAFIATKVPGAEALQAWVRAYQAFGQQAPSSGGGQPGATPGSGPVSDATMELSAFEVKSVMGRNAPAPKQPTVAEVGEALLEGTAPFSMGGSKPASGQSPGEFTRLFQEANTFEREQRTQASPPPPPPKPNQAINAIFGERLGGAPLGSAPAAPPVAPAPVQSSPGAFTREFLGITNEKVEPAPPSPEPAAPQTGPGAFTREFMAVSPPAPNRAEPAASQRPPRQTTPPPATSFESIFGERSGNPSGSSSPQPTSSTGSFGGEAENQKGGAGEFTSFFRDPFEHPGAPNKSIPMPDVARTPPPQKQVGDFTRMFGPADIERAQDPMLPPPQELEPAAGSFTKLFGEISLGPGKGSQPGASPLDPKPGAPPSFLDPVSAPPPAPAASDPFRGGMSSTPLAPPLDPFFSRTPVATPPVANPPFVNRPGASEATNVFKGSFGEASPAEAAPSGPSDFTMFISRSQLNAAMAAPPGAPAVNPGGGAPLSFAAPPVPTPPPFQFAPPPPPPVPAPPAMKVPAPPALPAAAPPVAPKGASFWPLVVVFTVLLAIAALLVMYFVLKH